MEDLSQAVAVIRRAVPSVVAVYLFGSRARSEAGSHSDFDLALLAASALAPAQRWELQEELASLLRADVDLVDMRTASSVMRVQVLASGTVLYDRSPSERALFEATALSAYARLNEERREILRDARQRGSIHG